MSSTEYKMQKIKEGCNIFIAAPVLLNMQARAEKADSSQYSAVYTEAISIEVAQVSIRTAEKEFISRLP